MMFPVNLYAGGCAHNNSSSELILFHELAVMFPVNSYMCFTLPRSFQLTHTSEYAYHDVSIELILLYIVSLP